VKAPNQLAPATTTGIDIDVARGAWALCALDSGPHAVVVVDQDLRVAYQNAIARTMFGGADSLDTAFRDAEFLGGFDGWAEEVARVIASGAVRHFSCALRVREPSPGVGKLRGSLWRLGSSGLPGVARPAAAYAAIWWEPCDAGETNGEQAELNHRLASLGKLAARVAHELNNPLDGIQRYINLALRTLDESTEPKVASYLTESRTGLKRMAQIIGDLLEFSRSTDGAFDDVPINDVVERAIRTHAELAAERRVIVAADFRTAQMPSIRGGRLFQVLSNLIKNALDAMPDGGRLTLTSAVVAQEVIVRVTDTGPGLGADAPRVFEAFFTTKEAGKGTGLGLAICRDFVEDMGGTIRATTSGGGAVFTVRIPLDACLPPSPARAGRGTLQEPEPTE